MKRTVPARALSLHFKKRALPFSRENRKIIIQFIFTFFFIIIGIWFIKHEQAEFGGVKNALITANWQWVIIGICLTSIYILLQGQMYVFAFGSVRNKVSLVDSTILFIKRNFISVFLPAGGISSLAFYTGTIESKGVKKTQIHFASSIYGFTGILSVVIVAVPAFIYSIVEGTIGSGEWYALCTVVVLIITIFFTYRSIKKKGIFYTFLIKLVPTTEVFMNDLQNSKIDKKKFLLTVFVSIS